MYLFTPPQREQTIVMEGSLRCTFPVSLTVWKDQDGTWQVMETPSDDALAVAQVVLAVTGRPSVVDDTTAAELTAAGIGTLSQIVVNGVPL